MNQDGSPYPEREEKPIKPTRYAAMYVRMSTDNQKYSTENQESAIRKYAAHHQIEIIETYADDGKSGLKIEGRAGLYHLIDDVQSARAKFSMILVLDVTRWGRFQDADESAYYEYICRRAGIDVQYVAEQFENDGSPSFYHRKRYEACNGRRI
jgi:DNA invertase Pin-like site-specific DNA recombinase